PRHSSFARSRHARCRHTHSSVGGLHPGVRHGAFRSDDCLDRGSRSNRAARSNRPDWGGSGVLVDREQEGGRDGEVRSWPLADIPFVPSNRRFRGKSGHHSNVRQCLLLTQSGQSIRNSILWRTFSFRTGVRVMARNFVKVLTAAIALGALISLGAQMAMARGGGGGHGGGGHGGGKHFSAGHVRGLSGAHFRTSRVGRAHIGRANAHRVKSARGGMSRNKIAHVSGTHARALGAAGALGGRAAWNQWVNPHWRSGWNGGWGGWSGPVFWPYFFGNLLAFTFWPYGYYVPFWGYGDIFVWDAIFWPGPYYAYGPTYYDVYGGYTYGGPARRHAVRYGAPETTGSISNGTDLAQTCGGLAPGVTDLPIDRIETTLRLTDEQLKALDALKGASSQASD